MEATVEIIGDIFVFTPEGDRLDASTVYMFKDTVAAELDPASNVIFDLTNLRFIDSTGLGVIVSFLKQSKTAGGELKLCGMSPAVRKLFELVRVHKIIDICETKEETLQAFHSRG
jgi:anti-sigma B factor antagonist